MTETVALIAALVAVAGAGGVIIALLRRCAQQEESCRLRRPNHPRRRNLIVLCPSCDTRC